MPSKLIHKGRLISLFEEPVPLRDGGQTFFDIVRHPGGAVILALNSDNEICLLKQWRHAIQKFIWELPAGCLEPNEPPELTAKRELEEEAGVRASEWSFLGEVAPSAGFSNELLYLYLAKNLSKGTAKLDPAERLEAHWVPLPEVWQMVAKGEIIDAKTLSGLLRLKVIEANN